MAFLYQSTRTTQYFHNRDFHGKFFRLNSGILCRGEYIHCVVMALICSIVMTDTSPQMEWSDRAFRNLKDFPLYFKMLPCDLEITSASYRLSPYWKCTTNGQLAVNCTHFGYTSVIFNNSWYFIGFSFRIYCIWQLT